MQCDARILSFISVCLGAVAVGTMSLAVATDSWLYTKEETLYVVGNVTMKFPANIRTGLWRLCVVLGYGLPDNCIKVGYDSLDNAENNDRDSDQETSMAIMRANRVSTIFPVASLLLLVTGFTVSVIGNVRRDIKIIIGSVVYITGGLMFAVGLILYISAINDEVGHRQYNDSGDLVFQYSYGWSFYFAGLGFLCAMTSAVVQVTLYLKINSKKSDMVKIIPGLDDVMDADEQQDLNGISSSTLIL